MRQARESAGREGGGIRTQGRKDGFQHKHSPTHIGERIRIQRDQRVDGCPLVHVAAGSDGRDAQGRAVAAGTYFARLSARGLVSTRPLSLVK